MFSDDDTTEEVAEPVAEVAEPVAEVAEPVEAQFTSREVIEEACDRYIEKLNDSLSKYNLSYENLLPPDDRSKDLVSLLTYVAKQCDSVGMPSYVRGTFTHRVAQIVELQTHPEDFINGKRFVELKTPKGEDGYVEIDKVIIRGDKHYIVDYKPIDLSRCFDQPWGEQFKAWLDKQCKDDLSEFPKNVPNDIKGYITEFLRKEMRKYRGQANENKELYRQWLEGKGQKDVIIKTSIQPYYVINKDV